MGSERKKSEEIPSSRRSLILDPVHPRDFNNMEFSYCCEQCSHFDETAKSCTIGYDASKHLREVQLKLYDLTGRMAFCRFMEID